MSTDDTFADPGLA